ncbi:MAG: hypothetical protein FDZ75_03155 [Actinobacteria bacterium]|nr:MAG: hypothetical protein FDZ75_03155 [Actinomycetota bacterium]
MTKGISADTTIEDLAAIVSQALESAGISAILSGGAAVSIYSDNEYLSYDLDFVSSNRLKEIGEALAPLGFTRAGTARQFEHANTQWFIEFPPGPLAFGETHFADADAWTLRTAHGPLRIVTPTQSVMDRLAAYAHWHDNQARDQAVMVARHQQVDWQALRAWAEHEGLDVEVIERVRRDADA